jgi:hypothetical protein
MSELTEEQIVDIRERANLMPPGQARADLVAVLSALVTVTADRDDLQERYNELARG